jgi:hypothetical protein
MTTTSLAVALLVGLLGACAPSTHEGLNVATLPSDVQPDYALFAARCSKCHSLSRALTTGIEDDTYWVDYVERMRRQPASGISKEDTVGILRFLHYFSVAEKQKSPKRPAGSASET